MSRLPIPNDWTEIDDGYAFVIACVPNSVQWRSTVRGSFHNLTRGRNWDETTGIITDVQAIAIEIHDGMCIVTCDDLITAIDNLAVNADLQELTKAVKETNAILASLSRDLTLAVPDAVDYTAGGVAFNIETVAENLGEHEP